MEKNSKTYEYCPHCDTEVELDAELKVQTCPHCGKRIVTCSMCLAVETEENYCDKCCLSYQAKEENKMKLEEHLFPLYNSDTNHIMEKDVEVSINGVVGVYDIDCYDGVGFGVNVENDSKAPMVIKKTYPKRDVILADYDLSKEVLDYRGLYDLGRNDITYGDIMMKFGETTVLKY